MSFSITNGAQNTAFRVLLMSLVKQGALPAAEAAMITETMAQWVRNLTVTPNLVEIQEVIARQFESMTTDYPGAKSDG